MPNVQTVKPVESAGSSDAIRVKAFDSPKAPIKQKSDVQINTIRRIEDFAIANRLQKLDANSIGRKRVRKKKMKSRKNAINHEKIFFFQLFVPLRQNVFRPIQVAPYSQRIKPLDKRFRFRSHSQGPDVMFDGYLP